MKNISWTALLLLVNLVTLVLSAPYDNIYRDVVDNQEKSGESRQAAQLVSGLVGTAVGAVASPIFGGLAPAVGTLIGTIVGQAISSATAMALNSLDSEDLLMNLRDQQKFAMKTYVINVPDVGPYVVMVRPEESEGDEEDLSGKHERPVYPGTERRLPEDEMRRLEKQNSPRNRIEIVPYKKLNFFKS